MNTMMNTPLTMPVLMDRGSELMPENEIVSKTRDTIHRYTYADLGRRALQSRFQFLAAARRVLDPLVLKGRRMDLGPDGAAVEEDDSLHHHSLTSKSCILRLSHVTVYWWSRHRFVTRKPTFS